MDYVARMWHRESEKKAKGTIISLKITPANDRAVGSKETQTEDAGCFFACNGSSQFSEDPRPQCVTLGNIWTSKEKHANKV